MKPLSHSCVVVLIFDPVEVVIRMPWYRIANDVPLALNASVPSGEQMRLWRRGPLALPCQVYQCRLKNLEADLGGVFVWSEV